MSARKLCDKGAMLNAGSKAPALRIEIGSGGSAPYKSIDHVVWDEVPPFALLTGLNGSGKTQLLEVLAHRLTGVRSSNAEDAALVNIPVKIDGDTFGPDSVAFVSNRWGIFGRQVLTLAEMQNQKRQLVSALSPGNVIHDPVLSRRSARLALQLGMKKKLGIDEAALDRLPDDFSFMLDETDVATGLPHVFLGYRLRVAEERERRTPEAEIERSIGPAPWDVLNQTFDAAGFPFSVVTPLGSKLIDPYEVLLADKFSGKQIRPSDLSSGEQTLFSVVIWLYSSNHHGRFPKLLLLDEPDAHLHPSMTQHFLNVLRDVLVARYGVRIIMSTHSPSTVALAPEESIFEMRRSKPRILRSPSKAETIGYLTSGLVVVSPGTRHVLVEDQADVEFYETIRDILTDYGPTRDPRAIRSAPSITFVPASLGSGKTKIAGGKSVVVQWLAKLDAPPLNEVFRGVIDRDSGNQPTARLVVLKRYSIENYYLDPFVLFGVLSDQGTAPTVPGVALPQGQEHLVRGLPASSLQSILDTVAAQVVSLLGPMSPDDRKIEAVSFTNGVEVKYPGWMIHRRGHDLLPLYQKAFGGAGVVSPPRLLRSLKRVRLIPTELADILDAVQS